MPSPVGHFLGGVAVGWLVDAASIPPHVPRRHDDSRKPFVNTLLFGCAAVVPDFDLLFHSHRIATHSVTAVLLVLAVALALGGQRRVAFAVALAGAVASHLLLDWFSNDPITPTGVMLLWPISREYFSPPADVFMSIKKNPWIPGFYTHNAVAVVREILILLPVLGLVRWWRLRRA